MNSMWSKVGKWPIVDLAEMCTYMHKEKGPGMEKLAAQFGYNCTSTYITSSTISPNIRLSSGTCILDNGKGQYYINENDYGQGDGLPCSASDNYNVDGYKRFCACKCNVPKYWKTCTISDDPHINNFDG